MNESKIHWGSMAAPPKQGGHLKSNFIFSKGVQPEMLVPNLNFIGPGNEKKKKIETLIVKKKLQLVVLWQGLLYCILCIA